MKSRQADYRKRKQAAGLVQLNLWVRPEHKEAIRAYAAELSASVISDAPKPEKNDRNVASDAPKPEKNDRTVTSDTESSATIVPPTENVPSDSLQEKIDRDIPPLPEDVEELLRRKEAAKAERTRKRGTKKKRKRNPNPIPQRCNENPAHLRRIMQYHHPDKNNPGADPEIFLRAKEKLKRVRKWHKHMAEYAARHEQ